MLVNIMPALREVAKYTRPTNGAGIVHLIPGFPLDGESRRFRGHRWQRALQETSRKLNSYRRQHAAPRFFGFLFIIVEALAKH